MVYLVTVWTGFIWLSLLFSPPLWSLGCSCFRTGSMGGTFSPSTPAQTVWVSQTTANSPMTMGIHFNGFYWATPSIRGTHGNISNSQLPHQTIPLHSYPELAQLFLTHIFSKHGTLSHVTSDWGSEFISHFFQSLSKLLWMELHFMSGYHIRKRCLELLEAQRAQKAPRGSGSYEGF